MRRLLILAGLVAIAQPVWAQNDISGVWARRGFEDVRAIGAEGTHIGDLTGIPLNEAGRVRTDTWDASVWSERERQAEPHGSQYYMVAGRILPVLDPVTRELVAYSICCQFASEERIIWMDGRPHPPEFAEHTWQGFSTGKWNGGVLTVTTTHLKNAQLNRNGTPASAKSVMTEQYIRHGDQLTVVQFIEDPAYLDEPMIRTLDFVRNPNPPGPAGHQLLEVIDEVTGWQRGYVPSYALGTKHTDWAEYVGLPWEASRGGKETLYPEYLPKLRKLVADYYAAKAAPKTPAAAKPAARPSGAR